jgi:choline transporter-like protein 2/4/5
MEYARLRGEAGSDVSLVDLGFQTDLRVYLHLRQTWMAFSESQSPVLPPRRPWRRRGTQTTYPLPLTVIILSILEVIIILLLIFLRKRILIAIALIKEASRWGWDGQGPRLGLSLGLFGP